MKKIHIFLFLLITSYLFSLNSGVYESFTFDFKDVFANGGKIKHTFYFVNDEDGPLKILKVKTTCGCTAADWSVGEIFPNEEGFVSMVFNPKNENGKIKKTIIVKLSNGKRILIHLTANVIGMHQDYGYRNSHIALGRKNINLYYWKDDKKVSASIKIKNVSKNSLKIGFSQKMKYLGIDKKTLEPHGTAIIKYTLYKMTPEPITIKFYSDNNGEIKNHEIKIYPIESDIKDKPIKKKAPIVEFTKDILFTGAQKINEKREYEFIFKNVGDKDLILSKPKLHRTCKLIYYDKITKKNERGKIVVEYLKKKEESVRLKFKTNSKKTPKIILQIKPGNIYSDISSKEAFELIQKNKTNFVILDVRTPEEFNEKYIENAINIDYDKHDFKNIINNLDKDKIYFVYCRTGRRSKLTMDIMESANFKEVYNLLGGITDWEYDTVSK